MFQNCCKCVRKVEIDTELIDAHCHVGQGMMISYDSSKLIRDMDESGVRASCIVPSDRECAVDNRSGNDNILSLSKKYPDRFIPFVTANPWYGDKAVLEIKRCAAIGAKGLKFAPHYQGFHITDDILLPLVECAAQCKLPFYITTGIPIAAMPMQLTWIAGLYPEVVFIEGRYGWPDFWTDSEASVVYSPNIYADISYNSPSTIRAAVKALGEDRVLYSSDAPYLNNVN